MFEINNTFKYRMKTTDGVCERERERDRCRERDE